MIEEWRPVREPKFRRLYEVSNLGRVRSLARTVKKGVFGRGDRAFEGTILQPVYDKDGYVLCSLVSGEHHKTARVHRLVCAAFHPNAKRLPFVNHLNGKKADNRVENLEWCDQSRNERHAHATGLKHGPVAPSYGDANGNSRLTRRIVRWIRRNASTFQRGDRARLAARYNVHVSTIDRAIKGDFWKERP